MTLAKRGGNPFSGAWPVCRKEFTHISRDRATLFFALLLPVMQLMLFGFAIDTNIRQIPTIVLDEARTQESRRLLEMFANSDAFKLDSIARSDREMQNAIVSGKAKAGIKIPVDFSRRLQDGQQATILVLIDGSDSTVTNYAVNVSSGIMLQESLRRLTGGNVTLPLEVRHAVLFNPSTRSANFFVPGMIAIVLQAMIIMLVAFSIVREREKGTLEQLALTPVKPLGLMVGKMTPYGLLGFLELCTILILMRFVFQVPIHGSLLLLLLLSLPFLLTILGIGLLVSTKAKTQTEAFQLAMGSLLPSVFLSGYMFLIDNMPLVFQWISHLMPATYYIAILRGVVLRGAGFGDLWVNAAVLTVMGTGAILLAARQFVRSGAQ
ncbi:MAG: ABC transporter permease [Bryobacteraceae bacterium]